MPAIAALALAAGLVAFAVARWEKPPFPVHEASVDPSSWPAVDPREGYATSATCQECHADQHESWHASYHRSMTQAASRESVVGPFDEVSLSYLDQTYHLETDGDHFWVELPDPASPDGETVRKQIVLCTGSHHMQVYWYPTGQSRVLAQFPFVYLIQEQRWTPRNAAFLRPPLRQATFETGRWNHTCIKCHTTGSRPLIEDETQVDSRVSEFGISCEACHGPGAAHVERQRGLASGDGDNLTDDSVSDVVNPVRLVRQRSAEVCGQCHSVSQFATDAHRESWKQAGHAYRPGGNLTEERTLVRARPSALRGRNLEYLRMIAGAFWPDGMVRVAGREYNGLVETACFQRGEMTCLSCHEMHKSAEDERSFDEWSNDQLQADMRSNRACLSCHQQFANEESLVAHTHHAASSEGSRCYNCHMPFTTYGLLKATRSHHLTSPNVAVSVLTGRPNACNQCHLDKTLDWTSQHLSAWYGMASPPISEDQRTIAASILWTLQGDAAQRALMAWTFGWTPAQQASGTTWMAPFLAELINDPYDAVRHMADKSLRRIEPYDGFSFDPLAAAPEREAGRDRLLDLWQTEMTEQNAPRISKSLLLDISGGLRREEFARLLQDRDRRPVTLIE
ncbi:MAG: multiheme c-type cytochrome [Planctomycetota bacterium]